ncbi:MAG: TIGR02186 family protein [Alphaproteobacteria bacterium]|nr:TIGR02186 family protein [Alphaproteobacteria bacterium]
MGTARGIAALAASLLGVALAAAPARADSVLVDLSEHAIAITSSFTGTQILCYGTFESDDPIITTRHDIVLVVRGPSYPITVRKKERVAGIFVNRHAVTFEPMPSYYFVASNRPLLEIASRPRLRRHGIGAEFLNPRPVSGTSVSDAGAGPLAFRPYEEALVRRKSEEGLYMEASGSVILRANLFHTQIPIPANAPVGNYDGTVYLMQDGRILDAQTFSFQIDKTGLERTIYRLAHDLPYLYGLIVIALAAALGFVANLALRQR